MEEQVTGMMNLSGRRIIEECLNNFKDGGLSLGLRMTLRLYREDREEEEGLLDRVPSKRNILNDSEWS
ncbi:unnamed protein product, partial [Brassica oleracea var. botrytis]